MSKEARNLSLILFGVVVIFVLLYKFAYTPPSTTAGPNNVAGSPATASIIPIVSNVASSHNFSVGPEDAKVTVVEYFDPECESCAAVAPYVKNETKHYGDRVRWIFRYMAYHHNSNTAIKVLEASRKQGLYLDVQQALFDTQRYWGEKSTSTEGQILEIMASVKRMNLAQLKADMQDPEIQKIIDRDKADGQAAGVRGTPTFFVNNVILEKLDLDGLIKRIEEQLQ